MVPPESKHEKNNEELLSILPPPPCPVSLCAETTTMRVSIFRLLLIVMRHTRPQTRPVCQNTCLHAKVPPHQNARLSVLSEGHVLQLQRRGPSHLQGFFSSRLQVERDATLSTSIEDSAVEVEGFMCWPTCDGMKGLACEKDGM